MSNETGLWHGGDIFKRSITEEQYFQSVSIHGETRSPSYCEAVQIESRIISQAQEIGSLLSPISEEITSHITNKGFRDVVGVNDEFYEDNLKEFEEANNGIEVFGVDSVIENGSDSIKIIEINSRPQFLGRFDHYNSRMVGENENSNASEFVSQILDSHTKDGISLIISHPSNAFHNYHKLLGQQINKGVATLQDLDVDSDGFVLYQGKRVDAVFRQFSMKSFMNPDCTKPGIIEAVKNKKLTLVNGPLAGRFGEKALLPHLTHYDNELSKYLPKMEIVTTGDGTNLKDFTGWWLKTTTGGQTELTIRLTKKNLTGWPGSVIKNFVAGDLLEAQKTLEGKDDKTAQRLKAHLYDLQKNNSHKWVLQEQIEPTKITLSDDVETSELNTTLRVYFMKVPNSDQKPKVFLEMLASKYDRVSGAGVTIPLRF